MPKVSLPVMEIFGPTIQGEGALIGRLTHFVRLGGCGYRCSWCDSMHAVDPVLVKENSRHMTPEQIVQEVVSLKGAAQWVTLSGGDPVIWDLFDLRRGLHQAGYKTAIETQGQHYRSWLDMIDSVTLSPKGPSSGMMHKYNPDIIEEYVSNLHDRKLRQRLNFKVVVFTEADLDWAISIHDAFPTVPFFLSVGTRRLPEGAEKLVPHETQQVITRDILEDTELLIKLATQRGLSDVTILPQLHVLIWGHRQGV